MIKRILINLVGFAYNWLAIYKIRAKQRIVVQRTKYIDQLKSRYK